MELHNLLVNTQWLWKSGKHARHTGVIHGIYGQNSAYFEDLNMWIILSRKFHGFIIMNIWTVILAGQGLLGRSCLIKRGETELIAVDRLQSLGFSDREWKICCSYRICSMFAVQVLDHFPCSITTMFDIFLAFGEKSFYAIISVHDCLLSLSNQNAHSTPHLS